MQLFTPIQYLQIDIASNFGLDREDWNVRIKWTQDNEHQFDAVIAAAEVLRGKPHTLMTKADSPALFYAGIKAYKQALRGEAITYPISLDATASGAQLLSCLIGCEKSAKLCNVLDAGFRADLYTGSYQGMTKRMALPANIARSEVKNAIMTWLYGSTAEPKKLFGEGEALQCFYETMFEDAPGISQLNMDLLSLWNPNVLSNDWVLPDNFHVHVKIMGDETMECEFLNTPYAILRKVNQPQERGLSIGANTTHSVDGMVVREMGRRCTYNPVHMSYLREAIEEGLYVATPSKNRANDILVQTLWDHYQTSGFLSARILENLDELNLALVDVVVIWRMLNTLPKKPFPMLSVHD